LADWHLRSGALLDDALAMLCNAEESPFTDGVLGDWTRQLAKFKFEARHATPVATLIRKDDVHLAEAGFQLALPLGSRDGEVSSTIAAAIEAHLQRAYVDDWILLRIAELLQNGVSTRADEWSGVHRELVRVLRKPHDPHERRAGKIMRNRGVHPRLDLIDHFGHCMLNTRAPTKIDTIVLPLLEEKFGTKGFEATQRKIFESLRLDADAYLARIPKT
jgi:hypothetical protein